MPTEVDHGERGGVARADTVNTRIDITIVNGGPKRTLGYAVLNNPARVRETVVLKTTDASGPWHYRDSFTVPKRLQVVAGVPIQVKDFKIELGGKPYARNYVTSTSCPAGGWKYQSRRTSSTT